MNYNSEFCSGEQFKEFVSELLKRELSAVEIKILEGFFDNKIYDEISKCSGYSSSHLRKTGKNLIDDIKKKTGLKINKKTFVPDMAKIYRKEQASSENGKTASELDVSCAQTENSNSITIDDSIALKVINSALEQRGNFSKTCNYYRIESNGRLSATCTTLDKKPSLADCDLNKHIINRDGNLEWSSEDPYSKYINSCKDCRVVKIDGEAHLVCVCRRIDKSWNLTQLNLDKRIDNNDGELWYVPSLMMDSSQ